MPGLNADLGHMEQEQTDHAEAMEQANPRGFSTPELRQGVQPAALLPGQATQLRTLLPKRPWAAGKEQGAAVMLQHQL